MRKLLKEISVIPGVTGSCIYDKTAGALCSEFKDGLPADLTENVGIHFIRLVQMGSMNNLNIKSAHFRFDRYSVVGLPLDTGAILLAICESDANCSLVATTAAMLAEDMRDDLTSSDPEQELDGHGDEKVSSDEPASSVDQGDNSAIKSQFAEIEDALAEAIGPVAGMVMPDYVNRWRQNGLAEVSRLGELITLLVDEISDEGLAKEFKSKIKHFL